MTFIPPKHKDIKGQRFGRLVAEEYIGPRQVGSNGRYCYPKTLAFWKCRCDCGQYWEASGADLRRGNTTHCGYCTPDGGFWDEDFTGRKFGNLTVIERGEQPPGQSRWQKPRNWICECLCGKKVVFKSSILRKGKRVCCSKNCPTRLPSLSGRLTPVKFLRREGSKRIFLWQCSCGKTLEAPTGRTSCGCGATKQLAPTFQAAAKRVQNQYQKDAAKRGKEWSLSDEEFYSLITSPCHYTGMLPRKHIKTQEGDFYWNGVDRKDNAKGYIPGNVLPCSDHANWAKETRDYDEFIEWLKQVAKFWKDKS